jgi:hypothetical protein
MINIEASSPISLWGKLNLAFISKDGNKYVDENTGISVQSFHNRFKITHWDPDREELRLLKILHKMGYSEGGTKITQLTNKYMDQEQLVKMKEKLREYREKDRFTLGMTFKNSPARSGGCLTGLQIVKYKGIEEAVIYAKIVELPKKFAADLYFFNGIFSQLGFMGSVHIVITCVFYWKVSSALILPIFGLGRFENENFRRHVIKKCKERKYLASPEYPYRSEARIWEYLEPIISDMIKKGELDLYEANLS